MESGPIGTHESNPLLRPLKKLLRRKPKFMNARDADEWRKRLASLCREDFGVELHPMQSDPTIVPSASVVDAVQGRSKSDPDTFLGTGYRDMVRYLIELRDHGFKTAEMERMLDLGFGTGRVLLHFLPLNLDCHGCDVNPTAVEFTRNTLGGYADLRKTELEPPLPYDEAMFDLVIATSVFTHTPYAAQPGWIAELGRVVKPGGAVLATIHDFDKIPPKAAREQGWFEKGSSRGLHVNTFLTREKVEELWSSHFEVLEVRPYSKMQPHLIARRVP
jgi:SAM-dependent methyltransferase